MTDSHCRYRTSPSVSLINVTSSMSPVSDDEAASTPNATQTADRKPSPVSKSTPARMHRESSMLSSSNINMFLERKVEADTKRAAAFEKRTEREHERELSHIELDHDRYQLDLRRDERDAMAQKFSFADKIIANDNYSPAVKEVAEAFVLRVLGPN